ncbi:asparagine synthetase (glutamine-hydrolyzing) [Vibrio nigripulchritudo ATCC 27043]|uniref:NnrS family protein n=1 Tax=Vibrio nigripulchritudo TaxID=28173 RepID=UPI00021C3534|nr:NnrS family protein [Vibrio nigripulchritudo]EGU55086.1 asparagine synthetase (glutamine-hydrolyzing) [Vibrio nigripulchritudo ATCC 27043]KJY72113.1 short-chain dehydrogenase [Vibrio nigripulchritudo]BDU40330.1 short-chain dehydrogenase [Vibrio nigripulchritudo]BDU46065.1 short-chain dehydrogenase [Vibrio nigripulchritudo]
MLNITDLRVENRIPPLLRLGFRPFFLAGALYAIVAVLVWVYAFQKGQPAALSVPALWWHVHEMFFGFAMAIVAGFVLTAVQNWTGVNGTKGKVLAIIFSLWLIPRLLFWTPAPLWLVSSIEALFLLAVAWEVGWRVFKTKGWRNLFFIPMFLLATVANFASYAAIKGMPPFPASAVWQSMMWWFVLLLAIMGGRVIPFFTARRFQFEKPQPIVWLEWVANFPLVLLFITSFFPLLPPQIGQWLMLTSAVGQFYRVARWKPWKTLSEPLVWSLHLAYLCIPLGLAIKGLTSDSFVNHTMIHLFALGALGGLILSMISRVTMGHTGREIYKGPSMWLAFGALILAAVLRAIGVSVMPSYMMGFIHVSALLWVVAFGMFVWHFAPMLCTPRVDGRPG